MGVAFGLLLQPQLLSDDLGWGLFGSVDLLMVRSVTGVVSNAEGGGVIEFRNSQWTSPPVEEFTQSQSKE
ncbi:hypothetical protein NIES2135_42900 [Leptolyngbya boryana NIES-2135]|uniref:Uncharacterized protein n=1 Tax=Leptolyngbya boryana NIES-2135 TaxID=1973484 RepID=A0A1Z4JKY6_LEPBY|nr:hypothetical protein NIES2135_42900 [Leptolyngbya boryana NIES-2135]